MSITNVTEPEPLVPDTNEVVVEMQECDGCCNDFNKSTMTYASDTEQYYCPECTTDLDHCNECDSHGVDLELSSINGRDRALREMCDNCRRCTDVFRCEWCDQSYDMNYHNSVEMRGSRNACQYCYDSLGGFECYSCENYFMGDRMAERDDNSYCTNCHKEMDGSFIHSYNYKPATSFLKLDSEKDQRLFFGLELEVERSRSQLSHDEITDHIQKKEMIYFKNDGSLNNGFEIVTHPMSYEYIQSKKESVFMPMLNHLIESDYRSYNAHTCGMHVHLSKKAFGTYQFARFIMFFRDNKEFITAISQRAPERLKKWATIEDDTNQQVIYKAKKKSGNSARYVALNLQNDHTMEIRIFRGTLNYYSFMKNLEFCYALFNFTRDSSDISLDSFKLYISQSNEYTMLKKFIKNKNL